MEDFKYTSMTDKKKQQIGGGKPHIIWIKIFVFVFFCLVKTKISNCQIELSCYIWESSHGQWFKRKWVLLTGWPRSAVSCVCPSGIHIFYIEFQGENALMYQVCAYPSGLNGALYLFVNKLKSFNWVYPHFCFVS